MKNNKKNNLFAYRWFMFILNLCEYLFLYVIIGVSIVCLIHILQGEPFSFYINW